MSDQDPIVDPAAGDPPTKEPLPNDDPLSVLSPEAKKIFEETQSGLLSALQKERDANKDAVDRLATIEKENQEQLEAQLQEQGKYKELADERSKALVKAKAKAEQYDTAAATLEKVLAAQIESIPEDKRGLIPTYGTTEEKLDYLSENRALLSKETPFDIGAGETGGNGDGKNVTLSPEQKKAARKANVTDEAYAKSIEK